HLYDAHFTRSGPVKSGRKSGKGRNPGVREKARLTTALCRGEPCERRGDWIRTSDLLNPIHKLTLPPRCQRRFAIIRHGKGLRQARLPASRRQKVSNLT